MPILSWITGWVNCAGWVALVATGGLLGSQLVLGAISLMHPVRKLFLQLGFDGLASYLPWITELYISTLAPISNLYRL